MDILDAFKTFVDTDTLFYHPDTVTVTPAWYTGVFLHVLPQRYCCEPNSTAMSSVKQITGRRHADKPKAKAYGHWINQWDIHKYCPTCRKAGTARGKLQADPCMLGDPCPVCDTVTVDQIDMIANRHKYKKKGKHRSQTNRPDLSAELDTEVESEVSISAEREATHLELSPDHTTQPEPAQDNPGAQGFHGKEPSNVQNVALNPMSHSTPATTLVPATSWRGGLQMEISNVRQEIGQAINAYYQGMRQS